MPRLFEDRLLVTLVSFIVASARLLPPTGSMWMDRLGSSATRSSHKERRVFTQRKEVRSTCCSVQSVLQNIEGLCRIVHDCQLLQRDAALSLHQTSIYSPAHHCTFFSSFITRLVSAKLSEISGVPKSLTTASILSSTSAIPTLR